MTEQRTSTLSSIAAFLRRSKKTLSIVAIAVVVTLVLSMIVSTLLEDGRNLHLPSIGNIHTVGLKAFWDPSLQNQTTEILWGTVYTGHSYKVTLYLLSISNVPTELKKQYEWTLQDSTNKTVFEPNATTSHYMNLTWDYNNQTLNPNETLPITLTLTADHSIDFIKTIVSKDVKRFTLDLTISAIEK